MFWNPNGKISREYKSACSLKKRSYINFRMTFHSVNRKAFQGTKSGEAWKESPLLAMDDRREQLQNHAREWVEETNNKVPAGYVRWLQNVKQIFGKREVIEQASKQKIMEGLLSLHAFNGHFRGRNEPQFWSENNDDVNRIKKTLIYLVPVKKPKNQY